MYSKYLFYLLVLINFSFSTTVSAPEKKWEKSFPYTLSKRKDIPIASGITSLAIARGILSHHEERPTTAYISSLDASTIPQFDKSAIYNWSPKASRASDIGMSMGSLAPLLFTIPVIRERDATAFFTLTAMYSEAYFLNGAITGIVKRVAKRPRPYLYGNKLSIEQKVGEGANSRRSFFSGHTSTAFCGAIFTAKVFHDLNPDSPFRFVVWGSAISVATTTGILRYTAGHHYPSDIFVGALIGSTIGFFIPQLHKKSSNRVSLITGTEAGYAMALQVRF